VAPHNSFLSTQEFAAHLAAPFQSAKEVLFLAKTTQKSKNFYKLKRGSLLIMIDNPYYYNHTQKKLIMSELRAIIDLPSCESMETLKKK
jgi:hypothetical protein